MTGPRVRRTFREDDTGMGQVVTLMVAGAIFFAAIGSLLYAARATGTDHSSADQSSQTLKAASLAGVLLSPGIGWTADPDDVQRLGLLNTNGSGIDTTHMEALRGAMNQSLDNGKVDYSDAKASLGMSPAGVAGFHIRVYPTNAEYLAPDLSSLSVAYLGDWSSLVSVSVSSSLATSQMAAQANTQLNVTMAPNTVLERQALRDLGVVFNDRVYITTAAPTILVDYPSPVPDLPLLTVLNVPLLEGDVYPDSKAYLDAVLANRLSRYDALVVGSGVDHQTLTSGTLKTAVRDWVLAGGTLIILGSDDRSTAWLTPLLSVGVSNVNGAPSAPDVSHPMLKEPYTLSWTSYSSFNQGWDIQAYDDFSHVVVQGGEDVLAVSNDASFGDGRIILTTFRARDIAIAQGLPEAEHLLANMLSYTDRSDLYLDYGGSIPADIPVAMAVRETWLWDAAYGQVPVRVEVLTWG